MHEYTNSQNHSPRRPQTLLKTCAFIALFAIAAVVLIAGCSTSKPVISNRMASIIVTNSSQEQIEAAARTVFTKHGYEQGKPEDDELVFQKSGSFMSGVVYGDLVSGGVWERIKVYQRDLDPARTVVECDGYMVQEHDDPLFQNEKREHGMKGHLQDLLNEVAQELKHPSAAPASAPAK